MRRCVELITPQGVAAIPWESRDWQEWYRRGERVWRDNLTQREVFEAPCYVEWLIDVLWDSYVRGNGLAATYGFWSKIANAAPYLFETEFPIVKTQDNLCVFEVVPRRKGRPNYQISTDQIDDDQIPLTHQYR